MVGLQWFDTKLLTGSHSVVTTFISFTPLGYFNSIIYKMEPNFLGRTNQL